MIDLLYHYIEIPDYLIMCLEKQEFQRLKNINQLSLLNYIYPNARHTRWDHVIGVAYLVKIYCQFINLNCNNNNCQHVYFTESDIKHLQLAALFHDMHGPKSHTFDIVFKHKNLRNYDHEHISKLILWQMYNKYEDIKRYFDANEIDIAIISDMIQGKHEKYEKTYLFQMIKNNITGLDVDKFDYLRRDALFLNEEIHFDLMNIFENTVVDPINMQLKYHESCFDDLCHVLKDRTIMHKKYYQNDEETVYEQIYIEILDIVFAPSFYETLDTICTKEYPALNANELEFLDYYSCHINDHHVYLQIQNSNEAQNLMKNIEEKNSNYSSEVNMRCNYWGGTSYSDLPTFARNIPLYNSENGELFKDLEIDNLEEEFYCIKF